MTWETIRFNTIRNHYYNTKESSQLGISLKPEYELDLQKFADEVGDSLIEVSIAKKIFNSNPSVFHDPEFLMTAPTHLVKDQVVAAKQRTFQTHYTMSIAQKVKDAGVEDILAELMADNINIEFKQLVGDLDQQDFRMCPYVPVVKVLMIDPVSFEPKMKFMARYGTFRIKDM